MKISGNFDRWMFDYKEGNLTDSEMEAFENFLIQNPEYEVDADAWDQAFIKQEDIAYPNAKALEKDRKVVGWYMWSAAAFLILLLGSTAIFILSPNTTNFTQDNLGLNNSSKYSSLHPNQTSSIQTNSADLSFSKLTGGATNQNTHFSNYQNHTTSIVSLDNSQNQSLERDLNENDLIGFQDLVGHGHNSDLITTEISQLSGNENIGVYSGNPSQKNLGFDVSKKSTIKYNSISSKIKRLYNKVEKMFSYPVGLTNLRDPELMIPQNTLIGFNPAFTGGMLKPRFEMNYRNQWLGSEMNSQELNISYDNYVYGMRGGVGVLVNAQDFGYGQFGDYNVSLLYSPKIVLSKNVVFEPAVKLTIGALTADGKSLESNSAFEMDKGRILNTINADQMKGRSQLWYKDFGLSAVLNTKWFYAGFNADNLGGHYENVYASDLSVSGNDISSPTKSPIKISAVLGTDYLSSNRTMTYSPFVAYQQFGENPELWGGMNFRAKWFMIGGGLSTNKEFTASMGMKFETFKLVYHYDYTESALLQNRFGSHNIGVRFNAQRKNQRLTH